MKIALIGYGKMGKTIERIAQERGHEIVSIIDIENIEDFDSEAFKSADVAIEFTAPHVAVSNIRSAFKSGVPVVCGTTGWSEHLPHIKKEIEEKGYTLFWASNYSLGVNIFAAVNISGKNYECFPRLQCGNDRSAPYPKIRCSKWHCYYFGRRNFREFRKKK
jgi:4-hydroxy-tetrahydrodipicolinate reductase